MIKNNSTYKGKHTYTKRNTKTIITIIITKKRETMKSKVSKEDIAYADDLLTRCESLPEDSTNESDTIEDEFEDDRSVFFLEEDSEVFGDDKGEDLLFLGFMKSNGKPIPQPSAESVQRAKSLLGTFDPMPRTTPAYEAECIFKNAKGEPWKNKQTK